MEIERKYLIDRIPDHIQLVNGFDFEQGYLCTEPVIRIRREETEYWLTYKSKGLMIREEANLPLTKDAYNHLLPKLDSPLVRKTRYYLPLDETHTIELDCFKEKLAPLIMAEVEFSSEEDALSFTAPDWFGREVTDDPRYQNVNLAFCSFADLI